MTSDEKNPNVIPTYLDSVLANRADGNDEPKMYEVSFTRISKEWSYRTVVARNPIEAELIVRSEPDAYMLNYTSVDELLELEVEEVDFQY